MVVAIFIITTAVCAFGWFFSWVSVAAMIKWISIKGYAYPTDEEIRTCAFDVLRRLFRIK